MNYTDVNSSAIAQVGYDPATGNCEVVFHNGTTSTHSLTPEQHKAFIHADSVGSHYARHVKVGKAPEPVKMNAKMPRK